MIQFCTCCVTDGKRSYFKQKPNLDDLIGCNFMHSWIPPCLYRLCCVLAAGTAETKCTQSYIHLHIIPMVDTAITFGNMSQMLKILGEVARIGLLTILRSFIISVSVGYVSWFYLTGAYCIFHISYYCFSVLSQNESEIEI